MAASKKGGPISMSQPAGPDLNRRLAHHEAGHAVMAFVVGATKGPAGHNARRRGGRKCIPAGENVLTENALIMC